MSIPEDKAARLYVAWRLIEQDLEFSTRLISSMRTSPDVSWLVLYGIIPYTSMFIYESCNFIRKQHPEIAGLIDLKEFPVIRRSRHTVKLLDDPHGIEQLARFFKTDVVAHFEETFAPPPNIIGRVLRPLYNDLGLYYYDGKLVTTTHVASFELGIERSRLNGPDSANDILAIYEEYGHFLAILGHGLEENSHSFANAMEKDKIAWRDVKSRKYYREHFDSRESSYESGVNCLLTALRANLAFLNVLVDIPSDPLSAPALCKIHFICAMHVVASCSALLSSHRARLDARSVQILESAERDGDGPTLASDRIKFVRNALVHYMPFSDFRAADLQPDAIYGGIIEKYCPELSFLDLLRLAVSETRRLGTLLEEWSEQM